MRFISIYLLVFASLTRFCAQNEASKWYFGSYAGLDFMTNPPTILTNSQMNAGEGSTSIADAAGNLLFYSDGGTIWNSAHVPMANGTGLAGSSSATQSGIIIKQPGNSNIYFIFTLIHNGIGGLKYSTVDMSLATGMGSVTVKNTSLYGGSCVEKLAATKHCNGQDIWVVSHDYNNANFRSFLVTATGVSTVAVVSSAGISHGMYHGQMKISPTGRKLGVALGLSATPFQLFDFDNATGIVSNPISLVPPAWPNYYYLNYGCEFSSDGSKFYGSAEKYIIQWDLCAGSASAISQSQYTFSPAGAMALQLAPNGKIYAARPDSTQGVINNPEMAGSACNFVFAGQSVVPNIGYWGLPNFVSSYLKKPREFDFFVDTSDCQKVYFSKPCTPNGAVTSVLWNFGDAPSGTNQSNSTNPTHQFSSGGVYTVQLIMYNSCSSDTVRKQVTIPNTPTVSTLGPATICKGQSATLLASGAVSYTWNNSVTGPMINISPTATSVYTVIASTSIGSCRSKKTFTVTVNPLPTVSITGNHTVCESDTLLLQANGALNYTWSPNHIGSNHSVLVPLTGSIVSVVGTDQNGCTGTASVLLNTFPDPKITVVGINEICAGETTTLSASGGNSYQWPQYGSGPTIAVTPLSTTIFTVVGTSTPGGCSSTELYLVNVNFCTDLPNQLSTGGRTLSVYPNPAVNGINVNALSAADIKILDLYGRVMYQGFVEPGDNWIDVSSFDTGIYFVSSPTFSAEIKFIKI